MMCNRTDKPYDSFADPLTCDDALGNHRADGERPGLTPEGLQVSRLGVDDGISAGIADESKLVLLPSPSSTERAIISSEEMNGSLDKKAKVDADSEDPSFCANKEGARDMKIEEEESTHDGKHAHFNAKDVLFGRGGGTNLHPGNRFYRELIMSSRSTYDNASKAIKPEISRTIVEQVHNRGGRFLRKDRDGVYREVGKIVAKEKTSQALRHRTFELRNMEDPNRVKMGGRWKQQAEKRSGTKNDLHGGSPSGVTRVQPRPFPVGSGQATFSVGDFHSSDVGLMLNGRGLKLREESANDTIRFQEALLRRRLEMSSMSPSDIPDDGAYQRALASLRHREAMLSLDEAIQEAQTRRRVSSINFSLSGSTPGNVYCGLSSSLHGTVLPWGTSSFSALYSPPYGSGRMDLSIPLRDSVNPGMSLRASLMRTELPFRTLTSATQMSGLLSEPNSREEIHQLLSVGLPGGPNLDRATLERL